MKKILKCLTMSALLAMTFDALSSPANDAAVISRGASLAVAADCGACHQQSTPQGIPFAGGKAIDTPMGKIVARNITPSKQHGIGHYTEQQFADALRKGIAADGRNLYPAMPYTAYRGLSDEDVHALYIYFMRGVKPSDYVSTARTDLRFPFNLRQLMWGWNVLYRDDKPFVRQTELSEQLNRGKYLVDSLAHCGTCHTPRNMMMAEMPDRYLSGSALGGWYAPNITPDASGIGDWSQQEIAAYLKTGHVANKAQAAGPMAEAVEDSFRYMSDSDLNAIAAWIKQVPAIATPVAQKARQPMAIAAINTVIRGQGDQLSLSDSASTDGAVLYQAACGSCHGRDGEGTRDHFYPSLTHNRAVSGPNAHNLVMAIADGVQRRGSDSDVLMPAFGSQLSDTQIAAISHYVRYRFGGIDDPIDAEQVKTLRSGGALPFIVRYMFVMIGAGGVVILLLLFGVVRWCKRPQRR